MTTVYVSFSADINPATTESLIACMVNCAQQGATQVHLLLSTPGGSVMNGINLYNVLRGLPFELVTHNVGNVDSIGNAVFLAGSVRYACKHSSFMFHGVGWDVQGRLEEKLCREKLLGILSDQKRIGSIIQDRTKIPAAQARRLFREMQTKDATAAVSLGIVHEIRDVQIPQGSPVISLVFKR